MEVKENLFASIKAVILIISVLYICKCSCFPGNAKEDIILQTTTPKRYIDRFKMKTEKGTIPPTNQSYYSRINPQKNQYSSAVQTSLNEQDENYKALNKVKSITPGEKTFMPQDDDDDDDDDGGEYEGFDDKSTGDSNKQLGKKTDFKESVPMMILREVDMVALAVPVQDKNKDQQNKKDKKKQECRLEAKNSQEEPQLRF